MTILEQHAIPKRFTFQFDSVRGVEINLVGPFDTGEGDLLIEWLDLVKRAVRRDFKPSPEASEG
jgi:hypothetical protein